MNTDRSLQSTIDASCNRLEEIAKSLGVTLTKTPSSVANLEEIIIALREMRADESALNGATFMVGAYLGEIFRSRLGGYWHSSADDLLLTVGETDYFPVVKARKFAANPNGPDGLSIFSSVVLSHDA